jgi:hypothetical protein
VRAILNLLSGSRYDASRIAGVVLGGDFNTVRSGAGEGVLTSRADGRTDRPEDARDTHMMGRLDYLFFRLGDGWTATTRRMDERFGSDLPGGRNVLPLILIPITIPKW